MLLKNKDKTKAIELRKLGFSYSEILKEVAVAKSTLSLWLREVGLSKKQKQRLTEKKINSMKRGWEACHQKRIDLTKEIIEKAEKDIIRLTKRELWLIGVALYWGEGHKEKQKSAQAELSNSDPLLIKIFLEWLLKVCDIPKENIYFRIFLHETSKSRLKEVKKYWSSSTGFPIKYFQKISWKKNKINTKRTNVGNNYFGLLRVTVKKSASLNRKIQGWIKGICKHSGVV